MKLATRASGAIGLLALTLLASPMASAESGWYVGLNVGASLSSIDDVRITRGLLEAGFTTNSIHDDDQDVGYKIYGGYQFNNYLALELGFFSLGEFAFDATTTPTGTLRGTIKLRGGNLDVVGLLPLIKELSLFARVGVNVHQAQDTFTGTGAVNVANPSRDEWMANVKFGLGVQVNVTESFGMRGEWERFRVVDGVGNTGDVDMISFGLVGRFGTKAPAIVHVMRTDPAECPKFEAAAPCVIPKVIEPVAVTFSADSLFDFDQATVRPAGKTALDTLAANLVGVSYEHITVRGHADRIGEDEHNRDLSTRRAEAVKAYLVETGKVPAGKIDAVGAPDSEPVTTPGQCVGVIVTPKLIACLQPDRRVNVEVFGTK